MQIWTLHQHSFYFKRTTHETSSLTWMCSLMHNQLVLFSPVKLQFCFCFYYWFLKISSNIHNLSCSNCAKCRHVLILILEKQNESSSNNKILTQFTYGASVLWYTFLIFGFLLGFTPDICIQIPCVCIYTSTCGFIHPHYYVYSNYK